jgi:outer membrane protein TolC
MKRTLILIISLACASPVSAAPRKLTLADAVQAALRLEPLVAEARLQNDRARLGVLRAQLDRGQLKVDGSLQELWQKSNIGGPSIYGCSDPTVPTYLCGVIAGMPTTMGVPQSPEQTLGLSNLQAQLNYYLFSGWRVEANVRRAKLNGEATLVQLKQQRKDTALAVARAYWSVRRLGILRGVQQAALQRMLDAERVAEARVRAGLAPPIDRNRAIQRKLTQLSTLADLDGQAAAAAAQLAVMLGLVGPFELVDDPPVPERVPATPGELVCEAFKRRPELRNARLQTEIQHQLVLMARSNFYPQVTLFGLFQYGNNQLNVGTGARSIGGTAANPFSGLSGNFTTGASLTMNFFDTLNTYTAAADARYQEQVAEQEARRYERLVDGDVRTVHANLLKLYERRAPLVAARTLAADNLRILEARYKNGDSLVIEYLDAQIDLANAELNLADVTAQLQEQWLELQASLGLIVGVEHD